MLTRQFWIALALAGMLAGCGSKANKQPEKLESPLITEGIADGSCDESAMSMAVLERIKSAIPITFTFELGAAKQKIAEQQEAIIRIRTWTGTIKDDCVREAYVTWLGHFQTLLDEARKAPAAEARAEAAGAPPRP